MNERINELWRLYFVGDLGYDEWKFAELIIKECVAVADDYVKDCLCEEHIKCNHPRSKIGIKIQKHFGVEE